jgi:hypothetical protein
VHVKFTSYRVFAFLALVVASCAALGGENSSEIAEAPQWSIPPSKLVNLNHPDRVPNNYIVVFKDDDELAKDVPMPMAVSLDVAPGVIPTTEESIARVGQRWLG